MGSMLLFPVGQVSPKEHTGTSEQLLRGMLPISGQDWEAASTSSFVIANTGKKHVQLRLEVSLSTESGVLQH